MSTVTLHATRCAICQTEGNATEFYAPNFDLEAFNPQVFSARRLPDRVHYRMVKCDACGLVRSDPVADAGTLAQLYARSTFDYGAEVDGLKRTYGRYLARLDQFGVKKEALLEIGCGNGFFLEQALDQGFKTVRGVEPSSEAVSKAAPRLNGCLVCDLMRPGLFEPGSFDAIAIFQVFDHIADPAALLDECFQVLKPGGLLLILNHNIQAASARLLGERSPIIDIEHTYLYSPATLSRLATSRGFAVKDSGAVYNSYTLHYLTRLVPLPNAIKQGLLAVLKATLLSRLPLSVPLGNLYMIAQKETQRPK